MRIKIFPPRVRSDLCVLETVRKRVRDAQSRQYVLGQGRRSGFEHLACYCGRTGKHLLRHTDRQQDRVCLPRSHLAMSRQKRARMVLHHNHPQSLALSVADIQHLVERPGLLEVFAHGHDGSWYWATSRRHRDGLEMIRHAEIAFIKAVRQLHAQGIVFKEYLGPHLFNITLDAAELIHYKSCITSAAANDLALLDARHVALLVDRVKLAIKKARQ